MLVAPQDDAVDELARRLFALRAGPRSTSAITAHITREIIRWSLERSWTPRTEARVKAFDGASAERLGFVDVIVRRERPLPDLAIEIDSTDKLWSVAKLRHAAAAGMRAIWIRWGDDEWAGVHDDIDVIQLPLWRRVRQGSRHTQPGFWG